jgi:hypothetical protein
MDLVGLSRGQVIAAGDKWRVTWGPSALHDIGQFFTFGLASSSDLQKFASNVYAGLPSLGVGAYAASEPSINTSADAFTIDVKFGTKGAGVSVDRALTLLDGLQIGTTLARVAKVSTTETAAAGVSNRDTVTAGAGNSTGVKNVVDVAEAAAKTAGGFLNNAVELVMLGVGIALVFRYAGTPKGATSKSGRGRGGKK